MKSARKIAAVFATVLGVAFCAPSFAQEFPSRPIHYIVPYSPGTGQDLLARVLAPEMSKSLGQPIIIENRTGAGTLIGYDYVAKQAPADGHTIAAVLVPDLATLPLTAKELRFDPARDLPPVIGLAEGRYIMGAAAALPFKTFAEFLSAARASPGKFNHGSASGIGRLSNEAVIAQFNLAMVYVPYSSGANYLRGLASGEIHMGFVAAVAARGMGEKFRILAVTGDQRSTAMPDVPTFSELGMPQLRGLSNSINAAAGIPRVAQEKLFAAASRALKEPEVRKRIAAMDLDIAELTADAAARRFAEESAFLASIAKRIGMQPQ